MIAEKSLTGITARCALVSGMFLFGGMLVGLLAGFAVNGLPMHVPEQTRNLLSALPVLAIITAAGAGWGLAMARQLLVASPDFAQHVVECVDHCAGLIGTRSRDLAAEILGIAHALHGCCQRSDR